MTEQIRIVIAEDHPFFRDGLRRALDKCDAFQIVAEAADGPAALEHIRSLRPEVAILDIGLPRMNGFAVVRELREEARFRSRSSFSRFTTTRRCSRRPSSST